MNQSTCPYCESFLLTIPQRKTKCKICGNHILVRTHPNDNSKILVTEQGAREIEALWMYRRDESELMDRYQSGFDNEHEVLTQKFGLAPRDHDVLWSLMIKERQKHSGDRQWGLVRNVTFDMARLLRLDNKHAAAAAHLVDVCCLDIWQDDVLASETSTSLGSRTESLASGVIERLSDSLAKASISFFELGQIIDGRLEKLPMLSRWHYDSVEVRDAIRNTSLNNALGA